MSDNDNFKGLGVPVKLAQDKQNPNTNNFHVIVETLTRMGISNRKTKTLVQTCHCFHKQGEYRIMHFKEMFLFDGKDEETNISEDDIARRNAIVAKLAEWGLLEVDEDLIKNQDSSRTMIIRNSEKSEWTLVQKYAMGKR